MPYFKSSMVLLHLYGQCIGDPWWQIGIFTSFVKEVLMKYARYDDEANLQASGQRWAKTKPNSEHVKTVTYKWKGMAAVIKHTHTSSIRWAIVTYGVVSCFITPPVSQNTPTNIAAYLAQTTQIQQITWHHWGS